MDLNSQEWLVTFDEVSIALNNHETDRAKLESLACEATRVVTQYCGRSLMKSLRYGNYPLINSNTVFLQHTPVHSILTLTDNNNQPIDFTLVNPSTGEVRINAPHLSNVNVKYMAGYTTLNQLENIPVDANHPELLYLLPDSVKQITLDIAKDIYYERFNPNELYNYASREHLQGVGSISYYAKNQHRRFSDLDQFRRVLF